MLVSPVTKHRINDYCLCDPYASSGVPASSKYYLTFCSTFCPLKLSVFADWELILCSKTGCLHDLELGDTIEYDNMWPYAPINVQRG